MSTITSTLLLEGPGDIEAVGLLTRKLLEHHRIFNFCLDPNPITKVTIKRLDSPGELERFLNYIEGRGVNSALFLVDTDSLCAKQSVAELSRRAELAYGHKRVGFSFFVSEYETFFIHCLDVVAARYPDYGWNLDGWSVDNANEHIVGAKGYLSRRMKTGKAYKETRDQVKFTSCLDFERLRMVSRSFRHFESTLLWAADPGAGRVYPNSGMATP